MPAKGDRVESIEETDALGTIVVKIGGSTLGDHDTTLADLVTLQRRGINPVVVHGGGKVISDWMVKQGVRPRFVRGLRVTDRPSLEIVVAVLSGLVNKSLVASISALGGRAIGISGADGGMLTAEVQDPELGLVGRVVDVNREPIDAVLDAGCIPVIAPVSLDVSASPGQGAGLLNVNADTAAGEIAAALGASRLLFLTDVPGVLDSSRRLIPRLTARQARGLMRSRIVAGGMVPKLEACLTAVEGESVAQILDGRSSHALLEILSGEAIGTRVE
jgi:acetylglutamate kinase